MNQKLLNLFYHFLVVYLDDVLVNSASLSEHMDYLYTVLQHLCERYFCAKMKRCGFL